MPYKEFSREISSEFISALNELYEEKSSWWRAIADDKSLFIAVRPSYLSVYHAGQSLLKIEHKGEGLEGIRCSIHEKYLLVPSQDDIGAYVSLTASGRGRVGAIIQNLSDFRDHLKSIKLLMQRYGGGERIAEQSIATRFPGVIDIEIAYGAERNNGKKGVAKRIDFAHVNKAGKIRFCELKLYANKELKPTKGGIPVVSQIERYMKWAENEGIQGQIISAYETTRQVLLILKGSGFASRRQVLKALSIKSVDPLPRLLIVGYDGDQEKGGVKTCKNNILRSAKYLGFEAKHLKSIGKVESLKSLEGFL